MKRGLAASRPVSAEADTSRGDEQRWFLSRWKKRGRGSGRVRMKVIPDFKAKTIVPFLNQNVSPGSIIYTDGLKSFDGLTEAGFKHVARIQPLRSELRKGAKSAVPLADRAI